MNIVKFAAALLITILLFSQTANAQVTVTGSAGSANGTYTTLKLAFDALSQVTRTQAGKNIVVTITASTTETAAAILNTPQLGLWTSLTIYPTSSGLSNSGSLAKPLIDLNGADNVTIDGRVNQAGAKDLVISNTSVSATAGTSTIRFINDATRNTLKYCVLKGSSLAAAGGILFFSNTSGTTGNDGNTIDNNDITSCADASRPLNGIYSVGTASKDNSENTISNNNIYDFFNFATASYGIYIYTNSTAWTLAGNSFYETTSFAPTVSVQHYVINIGVGTLYNDFTVSNNSVGGSAPGCGGTAWTKTNVSNSDFYAITLNVGSSIASNVQGNTIKNFDYSNSGNGACSPIPHG